LLSCQEGLACFHREAGGSFPPGCVGALALDNGNDFCYEPVAADSYGKPEPGTPCNPGTGYSYCPSLDECLRPWEETCPVPDGAAFTGPVTLACEDGATCASNTKCTWTKDEASFASYFFADLHGAFALPDGCAVNCTACVGLTASPSVSTTAPATAPTAPTVSPPVLATRTPSSAPVAADVDEAFDNARQEQVPVATKSNSNSSSRTAVATFYVVAVLGTAAGGVPLLW